jgi:hypothetical protein
LSKYLYFLQKSTTNKGKLDDKGKQKEYWNPNQVTGNGSITPIDILKAQTTYAEKEQKYISDVWAKVKRDSNIADGSLKDPQQGIMYDETTAISPKFSRGGVVYAQDGMRMPFNLDDIADKIQAK